MKPGCWTPSRVISWRTASVNQVNSTGDTALHVAAGNRYDGGRVLRPWGDLNIKNKAGVTPREL